MIEEQAISASPAQGSFVAALAWFALAVLCLAGFYETGSQYNDFILPQVGVQAIDASELVFYLWYGLWGSAALVCLALALMRTRVAAWLLSSAHAIAARPARCVGLAALLALCGALVIREGILLGQIVADDESTYLFEAQTLARGHLINEIPPEPMFWKQQFIVINEHGWYGKYPLGHPALLALGELLHMRALIVPLCGLASIVLCFLVGRRLFGQQRAVLGAALLACSPQFVWTHATLLSQPSACLCMLAGTWACLRFETDPRLRFAALSGLCFGLAVLVRPLPGVLFCLAALFALMHAWWRGPAGRNLLVLVTRTLVFALPLAACGLSLLWMNYVQSGSPLRSGYSEFHSHGYGAYMSHGPGDIPNSVVGALLRQNFWLFGWTCSVVFIAFCRPRRGAVLFWGLIAAEYLYRVIAPKTVVAGTGPIYVMEIVPLLALASADGAVRAADWLARLGVQRARAFVASLIVAASAVALCVFVPVTLRPLATGSALRARVDRHLVEHNAERAIVFANYLVHPDRRVTWAYYPPHPRPDFGDSVLYPRWFDGPHSARAAFVLWRQHFPDRRAFVFVDARAASAFAELDPAREPPEGAALVDLAGPVTSSETE